MATIINFKCKDCNQKFTIQAGLLQNDLANVREGLDLDQGIKLPPKEDYEIIYKDKTFESALNFIKGLDKHVCTKCSGEVVLENLWEAH